MRLHKLHNSYYHEGIHFWHQIVPRLLEHVGRAVGVGESLGNVIDRGLEAICGTYQEFDSLSVVGPVDAVAGKRTFEDRKVFLDVGSLEIEQRNEDFILHLLCTFVLGHFSAFWGEWKQQVNNIISLPRLER